MEKQIKKPAFATQTRKNKPLKHFLLTLLLWQHYLPKFDGYNLSRHIETAPL